jgi:hypothetical protein
MKPRATSVAGVAAAIALAGCLDYKLADDVDVSGSAAKLFVPQTRDFQPFRDWMMFQVTPTGAHDDQNGETIIYLNDMPPADATVFPVGTILVKTMKSADASQSSIHAMVKRGGNFNADGAAGWEFFELAVDKHDAVVIVWRGAKPPSGEDYQRLLSKAGAASDAQSDKDGDCNTCHAAPPARDGTLGDSLTDLLKAP